MISSILVHPDITKRLQEAEKLIRKAGFSKTHPDLLWLGEEEKLGIEQSRQIQQFLSLKPYQAKGHAVVLLASENLTLEAQNALLKTLEESPENTVIILGVASEEHLLPTILSRCQINYLEDDTSSKKEFSDKERKEIEKLLTSTREERFVFVEKLKEKGEFLKSLTIYFRHQLLEISAGVNTVPRLPAPERSDGGQAPRGWTIEKIQQFLKDLMETERWAKQNVNIRAILEYLMLKMPRLEL